MSNDHIGGMLLEFFINYTKTARKTGRTMSLVHKVKAGDRIIFSTHHEANRVKYLILEKKGINIKCEVIPQINLDKIFYLPSINGTTYFDHTWIEEYYNKQLVVLSNSFDNIQKQLNRK